MKTNPLLRIGIICAATFSCMLVGCVTVTTHNHFPEQPASSASAATVAQTASGAQCQCGANCIHHDGRYSYYPSVTDQDELAGGRAYPPAVIYAPPGYGQYPNGYYPPTVVYAPPVYRDYRGGYYPHVRVRPGTVSGEPDDEQTEGTTSPVYPQSGSTSHVRRRIPKTDNQALPQAEDDQPLVSDRENDGRAPDIRPAERWDHQPAVTYPLTHEHNAEILPTTRDEEPPVVDAQSGNDGADENTRDHGNPGGITPVDVVPIVTGPVTSSAGSAPRRTTRSDVPKGAARSGDATIPASPASHGDIPVSSSPRSEQVTAPSSRSGQAGGTATGVSAPRRRTATVSTESAAPVSVEVQSAARKTAPAETVLVSSGSSSAGTDEVENKEAVKNETPTASQGSAGSTSHSRRAQPK